MAGNSVILVDYREGSADLHTSLKQAGLPVEDEPTTLDSGDVCFVGRGQEGKPVLVGIEHKKISDLVNSFRTGRLQGHQLEKMRGAEEGAKPIYDFAYLMIEGELIYDDKGKLLRRSGRKSFKPMPGGMTVGELYKRILVLHLLGGLNPIWTKTRGDSVQWISALYHTFTDVDLDQHKSHLGIYVPPSLVPISQFRRTISTLPEVGLQVSKAASERFNGSISKAVNASVKQWAELETVNKGKTRKFGMSNATKVVEALR